MRIPKGFDKKLADAIRRFVSDASLPMRRAFTLIELLIVITILSILSLVVILILNGPSILQQTRDATRLSDLTTLNTALNAYEAEGGGTAPLGSSSIVYVSIPDPTATTTAGDQCQGLNLVSIPSSYTYHCAASSTFKSTNGKGWIPINLAASVTGSPIDNLPVDPVNQAQTFQYYTYVTNGSQFQIYGHLESSKYQPQESQTNGYDPASYKVGTNINIAPFAGGLAAYWPMNEGSGSSINDLSGYGNTGTIYGATWMSSGCNGSANCLSFDGTDDYVQAPANILNNPALTICAWIWLPPPPSTAKDGVIGNDGTGMGVAYDSSALAWSNLFVGIVTPEYSLTYNAWQYICGTRDINGITNLYVNGALLVTGNEPVNTTNNPTIIGGDWSGGSATNNYQGDTSNIRIYNRALSQTEIRVLYASGG